MTHREQLAWVAGFFDGEGHVSEHSDGRASHRPMLAISQKERGPLDRVEAAVGFGRVRGPYTSNGRTKHVYQLTSFEHIQAFCAMVWVWLGPTKREQFRRVLAPRRRFRRYMQRGATCSHCDAKVQARGLCQRPYWQWRNQKGVFSVFEKR